MTTTEKLRPAFPADIPFPDELELLCDWRDANGLPISGGFPLRSGADTLVHWFGKAGTEERLAAFGAGAAGSLYCVWRSENADAFPIVHLGSEGDDVCVLAENFSDFLRLLAVGYDELGHHLGGPDCAPVTDDGNANPKFQAWLRDTFHVSIPSIEEAEELQAKAAKAHPGFTQWVDAHTG